jgi:hypothetical protein
MEPEGFRAFWAAWPKNTQTYTRKGCKAECLKRWKARHHETQTQTILAHVAWMVTTADWRKDGGAWIPAPLVYLNQQRWDGAEIPIPTEDKRCWEETDGYQQALKASIAAMHKSR